MVGEVSVQVGGAADTVRSSAPRIPSAAVAVSLVLVGLVALGVVLWAIDFGKGLASFDQPLHDWFVGHRSDALTPVLKVVSALASETVLPFIVLLAIVIIAWRTRHLYAVALLAFAMVLSVVVAEVFKLGMHRDRPPVGTMLGTIETNGSFPSFHTLGATTLVLVLGYLAYRAWHTVAAALTWVIGGVLVFALVAGSRLYLGFHWPTDVLASAAIAVVILGVVIGVDRVLAPRLDPGGR